jgi:hypothetical protein
MTLNDDAATPFFFTQKTAINKENEMTNRDAHHSFPVCVWNKLSWKKSKILKLIA